MTIIYATFGEYLNANQVDVDSADIVIAVGDLCDAFAIIKGSHLIWHPFSELAIPISEIKYALGFDLSQSRFRHEITDRNLELSL